MSHSLKWVVIHSDEVKTVAGSISRLAVICATCIFLVVTWYFVTDFYYGIWLGKTNYFGFDWYDEFFRGILTSITANGSLLIMMSIALPSFINQMLFSSWTRKAEIEICRMQQELEACRKS